MMKRPVPPARLPKDFAEIWRALRQADEEAASRQALAAELGVSTHTLQRILVRGDVPSFRGNENRRVLHSWARTLSRLARRFERDPRAWITRVGIPWNEEIARIVAAIESPQPQQRLRRPRSVTPEIPEVVRIGLVPRPPFTVPLPGYDGSFLDVLVRRWIGSFDPKAQARVQIIEDPEGFTGLEDGGIDLLVGVPASTSRRRAGFLFVTVPGFRIQLGGLCIRSLKDRTSLELVETLARSGGTDLFLTLDDGIAEAFLAGACGIAPERIIRRSVRPPAEIASALLTTTEREQNRLVVLVAEEETCRRVEEALQRTEGLPAHSATCRLGVSGGHVPSWPLAIAMRSEAENWRELIEHARDVELFGAAADSTARLYAALAESLGARPGTLDPPMPAFEQALARRITAAPPSPIKHCRSCSASLSEAHNIGVSDSYCRWCSDESGHLRPRTEVERIISRWMQHWQGGITDEEALRRTRLYMEAMPAWSEN